MKRKIDDILLRWKVAEGRMPLLLDGARQVGKTYAVNAFGKNAYDDVVYANFEMDAALAGYFETSLDPARIVAYLEGHFGRVIVPGRTLLFFDEIQTAGRALESLKYFSELAPEHHVVAAGSLLGVAIRQNGASYPVGKIDELRMHPMDFEEFLWAIGEAGLAGIVRTHFQSFDPMPDPLHRRLLELYRTYLVVGGMPGVVAEFVRSHSLLAASEIQERILNDYTADTGKYATPIETVKIRACFRSIPVQLAKENAKFQYKVVQRGGTATIFGSAIDWLEQAGIALKCQRIDSGLLPISSRVDLASFKLYMNDVGLLTKLANMPQSMILSPLPFDNDYLGRLTENMVAQMLARSGRKLYYWTSGTGDGELDFVIQDDIGTVPIEVKKGVHTRSVSLNRFIRDYACITSYRVSQKNFGNDDPIRSIPLYAVHLI